MRLLPVLLLLWWLPGTSELLQGAAPLPSTAQDTLRQGDRLKVGLVLSGGGAKGFAHLGAIKVIERAGVHIDYIGGTSIGAIVGGLYATGWSTEQIDSLIQDFDILEIVQDKTPRRYRLYYDKQREGRVAFRLGMNRFKLQFPSAISHGQNLINKFADWTIPAHTIDNFDRLSLPYFAKATDLEHGTSVKLDRGYLPEAMRASGTFPSLLTPFSIDSTLLVDGGVLDNYPVDQMRATGVDIVIGINIGADLYSPEKLGSVVGILDQLISFQTVKNAEAQRGNVDLEIKPDIAEFNAMSFSDADSIYQRGVIAAEQQMEALQAIARAQQASGISPTPQPKIVPRNEFRIEDIRVSGSRDYPREYFLGRLDKELPGLFSLEDIHRAISRLYATGNFHNVYYRLQKGSQTDSYLLEFIVNENPTRQYIGIGWTYDRLFGTNILLNLRINNILPRTIFETDVILGKSSSLGLSLFRDNGKRPSLGINFRMGQFTPQTFFTDFGDDTDPAPMTLRTDISNGYVQANGYIQTTVNQKFTAGIGLEYLYLKSSIDNIRIAGKSSLDFENTYFFAPNLYLSADTRDDRFFPTRGFYLNALYKVLLTPNSPGDRSLVEPPRGDFLSFFSAQVEQSISLSRHFSATVGGYAGLAFCEKLPFAYRFFPGGVRAVMPFNYVSFYGLPFVWNSDESTTDIGQNNLIKAGVKLQYSPAHNHYLIAAYNYGLTSTEKSAFRASYRTIQGAGIGYCFRTPFGKLELIGTYSPNKTSGSSYSLFFSTGMTF